MFSSENSFVYPLGPIGVVGVDCFLYMLSFALYTPCVPGASWIFFFFVINIQPALYLSKRNMEICFELLVLKNPCCLYCAGKFFDLWFKQSTEYNKIVYA